jgi:hypothetical protein
MHGYVVPKGLKCLPRERFIDALCFLQTDDIGLTLGEPAHRIVRALLDGIDVPGGNSHGDQRV